LIVFQCLFWLDKDFLCFLDMLMDSPYEPTDINTER